MPLTTCTPDGDLAEEIGAAFRERSIPPQAFMADSAEARDLGSKLRGLDRCAVTNDFVLGIGIQPGNWLSFMTDEGRLYYLPALMSLCVRNPQSYGALPESILKYLSPWPFLTAPHEWTANLIQASTLGADVVNAFIGQAVGALIDPGEHYRLGAALVSQLNTDERRATKSFVRFLPNVIPMDALLTYHIEETLDGRIRLGDGYSWLPQHETAAIVDFIDFVLSGHRHAIPLGLTTRLLSQRNNFALQWPQE